MDTDMTARIMIVATEQVSKRFLHTKQAKKRKRTNMYEGKIEREKNCNNM